MHRKTPISVLVYNTLFPNPQPSDPSSFSAHLSKNLVGEVRIETATFYGSLDTIEARYPGLNYAHAPHRKRLGRFPHHRKLFEAFDKLGLTESEIQGFCRWEGTLWARERYERDEGVKVKDTTGMEIGEWVDTRKQRRQGSRSKGINVKTDIEVEIEEVASTEEVTDSRHADTEMRDDDDEDEHDEEEEEQEEEDVESDEEDESVGYELNQRLIHAAAMREQGHTNVPMDPEWEQYLKEAQERGDLNIDATREVLRTVAGHIARIDDSTIAVATAPSSSSSSTAFQQSPAAPA